MLDNAVAALLWHLVVLPLRLLRLRPQLVHVTNGRIAVVPPGVRKLTTLHDVAELDMEGKFDRLRMLYRRWLQYPYARRQGELLTISESAARDLELHLGIPRERLHVIPNVVTAAAPEGSAPESRRSVLYVGRIDHPSKNLLTLLAAFERAAEQVPGLRLDLAGSDSWNADVVHAAASSSAVRDRITFHGWVTEQRLAELYAEALVLCQPSLHEGFGVPVIEALNAGVPVLAADAGALPEVLGTQEGLLAPTDVEAWARALREVSDPQRRAALAHAQVEGRDLKGEADDARRRLLHIYGLGSPGVAG